MEENTHTNLARGSNFDLPSNMEKLHDYPSQKSNPLTQLSANNLQVIKICSKDKEDGKQNQGKFTQTQLQSHTQIKAKKTTEIKSVKLKTSKIIVNHHDFLLKPVPESQITKCCIYRQATIFSNELYINLKGEKELLVQCQKQWKPFGKKITFRVPGSQSKHHLEVCDEKMLNSVLGCIEGNFNGTVFNVFCLEETSGASTLVATIQYISNLCTFGGPRKVKIYLRSTTLSTILSDLKQDQNLKDYFNNHSDHNSDVCLLQSEQPILNQQTGAYRLPFHVDKQVFPSVHNTVISNEGKPNLKFFKADQNTYEMWLYNPMSPIVGCAYALSSFIFKLATQ